jgi:hypothetical protein
MSAALSHAVIAENPEHENRRRSVRRPYAIDMWVWSPTAVDDDDKIQANAVNLSRHGVRFESAEPLAVGCFYIVELGMGEQKLTSEVRIVSCRQTGTAKHSIGAAFC